MRILHTADWHLGQKLLYNDREEEHQLALQWLLDTIHQQQVDLLLVAGDIFDIGNPPNSARSLYYRFLTQLRQTTTCRHVVIIGGNHDSPAMLNAPRELLQTLDIHVLGAATDNPADELVVLHNAAGQPEAAVAAVPFLRDRDLRTSIAGENPLERQARLQEGLQQHYQTLAGLAEPYAHRGIPILATGHLYASGAVASARQDNIYVGNRENMEAGQFPALFHYVALGHIHRAQLVGGAHHIRYAGSLIPLSFSETQDDKQVYILNFQGNQLADIQSVPVPVFRRLKTIQGSLAEVKAALLRFAQKDNRLLTPWVDLLVHTEEYIPQLDAELREFAADLQVEILKIRVEHSYRDLAQAADTPPDLDQLGVEEVFLKRCEMGGDLTDETRESLLLSFRQLQEWMHEQAATQTPKARP